MKRAVLMLLLLPSVASAQSSDDITFVRTFLLRNISGTAWNPGPAPHHAVLWSNGGWSGFAEASAFVTNVSETGPPNPERQTFSTNWFAAGAQRTIGSRGLVLLRGRASLEPWTIPERGYPQLFQNVPPDAGGPLADRMRAQNFIGEAAADFAYRVTGSAFAHLYAAAAGDPPLGTVPFAQRASSEEFAEAPFAFGGQESFHDATRVVTAGVASRTLSLEGGVFHHAITSGRRTTIEGGNIDSWAGRVTLSLSPNSALQYSRGKLGDAKEPVSSASMTYGTGTLAVSAIWTRREPLPRLPQSSFAFEILGRGARGTLMARAETVDLTNITAGPANQPSRRTHFTFGGIADAVSARTWRAGVGVNIDYHSNTKLLTPVYGHKPQSIYLFARVRTNAARR